MATTDVECGNAATPDAADLGVSAASPSSRRRRAARGMGTRFTVNLTSLIDVTFLLLIYFMVATTMSTGEQAYRMDIPDRTGAGEARDPFSLDIQPLHISVRSTGTTRDSLSFSVDGPVRQPTSAEDLFDLLWQHQVRAEVAGGWYGVDHPIIIMPAEHTRWEHVIEAFNAAHRAGYVNITFGETP